MSDVLYKEVTHESDETSQTFIFVSIAIAESLRACNGAQQITCKVWIVGVCVSCHAGGVPQRLALCSVAVVAIAL